MLKSIYYYLHREVSMTFLFNLFRLSSLCVSKLTHIAINCITTLKHLQKMIAIGMFTHVTSKLYYKKDSFLPSLRIGFGDADR